MSHLVTRPRHSIINQAFESKLRFPSSRPMNVSILPRQALTAQADGFGIGWYDPLPPLATQVAESPHGVPSSGPITPAPPARPSKAEQQANGTDHVPNQLVGGEPTSPGVPQAEDRMRGPATPGVVEQHLSLSQPALDDESRAEQLRLQVMRADEREVENERPCVFKSISPVSIAYGDASWGADASGMEQCESDEACGKDSQSARVCSCARVDDAWGAERG